MKIVDFGGDPNAVEAAQLAQRQKLAELMAQQGMDTSPILSPWQGVARIAQAFFGNYDAARAGGEMKALAERQKSERQAELGKIVEAANDPNMGRSALAKLLVGSQDPALSQAGLGMLLKSNDEEFGTTPVPMMVNGKQMMVLVGKRGSIKPIAGAAPEPKYHTVGNALVPEPQAPGKAVQPSYQAPSSGVQNVKDALTAAGIDPESEIGKAMFKNYAETKTTHAPAASVNVSTDKKFGQVLADDVAKQVAASADAARSALQGQATIQQIRNAIATGKVSAGPGTTFKLAGQQLAMNLGFKPDADGMAETRKVIQGLAQMTLNARGSLKGQGQVSDFEGRLVAKAASGDIDSMSIPEIQAVMDVMDRVGRATITQHQQYLETLKKDKDVAGLVPFFEVGVNTGTPGSNPNVDDLVKKYTQPQGR